MDLIKLYSCAWNHQSSNENRFFTRGFVFYKEKFYDNSDFVNLVVDNLSGLSSFISELNGNFSIIISGKQKTYLISDRMRTYSLVYFFEGDSLIVTDDIIQYKKDSNIKFKIDEIICEQFLSSNYIIGPFTIFKDVYSTQSGEMVVVNNITKSIDRTQYFQWTPYMQNDQFKRDYEEEAKQQEKIFISVFNRMIKSAPNVKNWIIPLSGGYDSRTIVNYLYKLGIKNVICFTYGMESNIQSEISRQVAEALGYEWHFIDYKIWVQKMKTQNLIDGYLEYAFNGSSVSHLQDFPAIYALKEMGLIHENDIFVPGHALEVIAGNHLKLQMKNCNTIESVIPVIKKHFSGFGYYTKERNVVFNHVKQIIANYNIEYNQMAECFDWQERQTKFIANSVKVYEFFGYGWRIPEWDIELMNYWDKIGFNYRYDRNMFKDIFKKYLTVDVIQSIPFANDLIVKKKRNIKAILRVIFPIWLKSLLKKRGIGTSQYYVNEGSHLIYSDINETIADYLSSFNVPVIVKEYLKPYSKKQKISNFEINAVTTLLNIRKSTH